MRRRFNGDVWQMKIVHILNHCDHGHGNAHVAIDLACVQARNGHDVSYISSGGDYEGLLKANGVRLISLDQRARNPMRILLGLVQLIQFMRKERPDIVHAHMMAGMVFAYFATRIIRTCLVATVHNSFDKHSKLMKFADVVVAVSEAERRELAKRGFDKRRLRVVVNGPNESPRANATLESISFKRPHIVTISGMHKRKGLDDLLNAFAKVAPRYPNWTLTLVGDGPDRVLLNEMATKLKIADQVNFAGSLHDIGNVLRQADIFTLTSLADPCSLALAEARYFGCPIIATAVGGSPELVSHGNAGKLVPPHDVNCLSKALDDWMSDEAKRRLWSRRSMNGADYLVIGRVVEDYDLVYHEFLDRLERPQLPIGRA